jgi:hypothetical protein
MRLVLSAFVALALSWTQGAAQTALLIGVRLSDSTDNTQPHPSGYRTFLITFRDAKAQIAADLPDLIVPRKNGFWRAGILSKGAQGFVYAAPVQSVPRALGEYHPPNPEWSCSDNDESAIEFVNPDLISVFYFHEPACSLEEEMQHTTYGLDRLGLPLDIADVLGPAAWAAERKADSEAKSGKGLQDCVIVSKADAENWAIEGRGRIPHSSAAGPWTLVGNYNAQHVCNGGGNYEIKFPVPRSITGAEYHADLLAAILKSDTAKKNGIRANDCLLTPDGDFLIEPPFSVFQVENHTIQTKPAFSVPTSVQTSVEINVVMIQWAMGKHVAEWESELKAIAATKLPEPVVDIREIQK